jgi:hypothetical protein
MTLVAQVQPGFEKLLVIRKPLITALSQIGRGSSLPDHAVPMLAVGTGGSNLGFHKFKFIRGQSSPPFTVGDFDIHNIRAKLWWTRLNRDDLQKHSKQIDK